MDEIVTFHINLDAALRKKRFNGCFQLDDFSCNFALSWAILTNFENWTPRTTTPVPKVSLYSLKNTTSNGDIAAIAGASTALTRRSGFKILRAPRISRLRYSLECALPVL